MVRFSLRGISKGDQEKIMWNFQGPLFLALEFPRDLTQFCGISRVELCFVRNFKRSRQKKKNSRGFSKRHVINPPSLFGFFWNSPFLHCVWKEKSSQNILFCNTFIIWQLTIQSFAHYLICFDIRKVFCERKFGLSCSIEIYHFKELL